MRGPIIRCEHPSKSKGVVPKILKRTYGKFMYERIINKVPVKGTLHLSLLSCLGNGSRSNRDRTQRTALCEAYSSTEVPRVPRKRTALTERTTEN